MLLNISVHFLFYIFLVILIVVFLLIVVVLYYSFNQFRKLLAVRRWSTLIEDKVVSAVVNKGEVANDPDFKMFSQQTAFRNLFLEKLIESEKKFSGSAQKEIIGLYEDYHLEKESFCKLDQKQPHLFVGGIQELTAMKVEKAVPKIASFLNHPSVQVYQEAQYAMVNYKGFEGLRFLDETLHIISDWQQLRLLLSLTDIPQNAEASIEKWLQSPNDSVSIFTLRLLRKFQMLTHYPDVLPLMSHASQVVRIQAVQTLQSLENSFTTTDLTEGFSAQPLPVQLEIIRALMNSKDPQSAGFLKTQLLEHSAPGLRILAADCLIVLGFEKYLRQLLKDQDSSEELIQIIKHALQEKIC